jgi:predicted ATP-dependent Lon-type protease
MELNPEEFIFPYKLLQLTQLTPFVENNYKLIGLDPKGQVNLTYFKIITSRNFDFG